MERSHVVNIVVRARHFLGCALLAGVVGWSVARADASETVEVRVYADYVNFRSEVPHTFPQRELVQRHFQRIETLAAHYQRLGPSPAGGFVPWFYVTNRASGETGWIISTYVQPIDSVDARKLRELPFDHTESPRAEKSLEEVESVLHLNFVGFLLTLFGLLIAVYAIGHVRGSRTVSTQPMAPSNVVSFPGSQPEPDTLFGMAGNQVWIHRSRQKS